MKTAFRKTDGIMLLIFFLAGVLLRLLPRINLDPHLLTFQADIWYRICLAQYLLDHGHLPFSDIRYLAYGHVPFWYNPLAIYFLASLSKISMLDLPTVCSRVMPWIESLSILPFYLVCQTLYNRRVAILATGLVTLSPSYIFWTGIATLQSFTIFLLPIVILLWIRFTEGEYLLGNRWRHLFALGVLFAINFLTHLSFFTMVIILLFVQLSLILEHKATWRDYLFFLVPLALSQILTAWWWLPENLYWWWTMALTTSSGIHEGLHYLKEYGTASAIIGHLGFIGLLGYVLTHRRKIPSFFLLPIFWAIFPMLESHNEGFLILFRHLELSWNNFFKPLEGFRFYLFLIPPLSICFALCVDRLLQLPAVQRLPPRRKSFLLLGPAVLSFLLFYDMFFIYRLQDRFRTSGMDTRDILAAQWFKTNTPTDARILTEYYTAQMFSGICGGKALLGSLFPLKKVSLPYITDASLTVAKDIYSVYTSYDINHIRDVLQKYGCTHVYISNKTNFFVDTTGLKGYVSDESNKIKMEKLLETFAADKNFRIIYDDNDIKIIEWMRPRL